MHKLIKTIVSYSNGCHFITSRRYFYDGKMINEQRYNRLVIQNQDEDCHREFNYTNGRYIERFVSVFN